MRVFVSGSLAYDRIMDFHGLFGDHILSDKTHQINISFYIDSLNESFGGTAGNISYALALLGESPTIISTAGSDFAPYRLWLDDHGIDTSHIRIDESEKTAFASIITDKKNNQISAFYPGAAQSPSHPSETLFEEAGFGIVAAGNLADMRELPRMFRRSDYPFMFDPGQQIPVLSAEDLENGIKGSVCFISNDYELAMVMKKTGWKEADMLKHTEMIVTTFGEKGSRILTKDDEIVVSAATAKTVKDPTGAGDAYRSGFVHGLLKGWPLGTVGKFAGLVACYTVEVKGTQAHSFTESEMRARYEENFAETLPVV